MPNRREQAETARGDRDSALVRWGVPQEQMDQRRRYERV